MIWQGKRVAVAGMGRSGIGVALAAQSRGAIPTVYDEQDAESQARLEALDRLQSQGIAAVTGWHGRFQEKEFDVLVASPGFKRVHPAIRDCLELGIDVISEVEFAYSLSKAPIVAITGTNGKSTTTAMTWAILRGAGKDAILCGNIAGSGFPELTLTEAALESQPEQILVAEVSSYQLEWVKEFRPRAAAVTNITPDHLERHPSFEDYRDTKLRIFAAMGEGDTAVLNDSEQNPGPDVIANALPKGVEIRAFSVGLGQFGRDREHWTHCESGVEPGNLRLSGRRLARSELKLFGQHNMINAVMAWELSSAMIGPPTNPEEFEARVRALVEFKGLRNRMEILGERNGVIVINNSMCTNPAAVVASCRSVPRKQHILMGGLAKNLNATVVGEYLRAEGHVAYVFGDVDSEWRAQIGKANDYATLDAAFAAATEAAQHGHAIVLAPGCASAAPYVNFQERGDAFRELAVRWLRQ